MGFTRSVAQITESYLEHPEGLAGFDSRDPSASKLPTPYRLAAGIG